MNSYYHMIDVSDKLNSKRTAIARGKIIVGAEVLNLIITNQMIKGDPLRLAEIAAIMGAKQTSNLIPLCHPLGLDKVEFVSELLVNEDAVQVYCIATTSAKTGVEMEALTGVSAGLLTIYDLSKISEPALKISDIELVLKIGGKSGIWFNPNVKKIPEWVNQYLPTPISLAGISIATITLSDRASQRIYPDLSGQKLQELLIQSGAQLVSHHLLPDEPELMLKQLHQLMAASNPPEVIITTGGTGIGQRDTVPEAIEQLHGRQIPGIGELLRLSGSKHTTYSWGSRSLATVVDKTLIITLPGSIKAVEQSINTLLPILGHLVKMIAGGKHD
jgi:molybdenum cofactor biosynthesis protein MoaC